MKPPLGIGEVIGEMESTQQEGNLPRLLELFNAIMLGPSEIEAGDRLPRDHTDTALLSGVSVVATSDDFILNHHRRDA